MGAADAYHCAAEDQHADEREGLGDGDGVLVQELLQPGLQLCYALGVERDGARHSVAVEAEVVHELRRGVRFSREIPC
eukprot:COSAG01_NODE_272_length_19747_cov_298.524023_10_plen_78_part_00